MDSTVKETDGSNQRSRGELERERKMIADPERAVQEYESKS